MDFMDSLVGPPKKEEAETAIPSSPPQLYSLQLGSQRGELSRSATAAVVDALSRSGLPFFGIANDLLLGSGGNPAIEAQVKRNQRNFLLGLDSTRVPATSLRLFIYRDPFAGKAHTLFLSNTEIS